MEKYYYMTSDVSSWENNQKIDTIFVQYKYNKTEIEGLVFIMHKIEHNNLSIRPKMILDSRIYLTCDI